MKKNKIKLAFVGNSSHTMQIFRLGLLLQLVKNTDYAITVIAPQDSEVNDLTDNNINFIPITLNRKGTNPFEDIQVEQQLYKIYTEEKFDYIFHYTIKAAIYGSVAARRAGISQVSIITGLGYSFLKDNSLRSLVVKMYRYALRSADEVWFLNEDDKQVFINNKIVDESKTKILNGEGVDTQHFIPSEKQVQNNPFSFLLIGRALVAKGYYEYAAAAHIIHQSFPQVKFRILGPLSNDDAGAISAQQLQEWVNNGDVEYLGSTNDVMPFVQDSSCIVLPSYREGVPRVLLEAASMQKPIIATDVAGCREVVKHEENGYLVEVKNSQSLADAMLRMLQLSDTEREQMGINGRQLVLQQFDEKIIAQCYTQHLNSKFHFTDKPLNVSLVLYNTPQRQLQHMLSLFDNSNIINRVYIIDNSPERNISEQQLKEHTANITYIHNTKNLGYGKAHNIALKQSLTEGAQFHLVTNADIHFEPQILNQMVEYMQNNLDVGLIVPKVYYPSGKVQYLCKLLPSPIDLFYRRFVPLYKFVDKRISKFEMRSSGYDKIMNVPFLSGCFMLISTYAVRHVGMFDERFFMYAEDIDYSRRIHRLYKTIFYPKVKIIHDHEAASYHNPYLLRIHIKSVIKYFNKWGWIIDPERHKVNKKIEQEIKNLNN